MKLMTLSLVVGCICFPSMAQAQAAPWTSAKFPNEQNRAAQGCASDPQKAGDWLCIFVRCDQPGSPVSLHFSALGPEIQGKFDLVVDDDTFTVSVPASLKSALPLSTRAEAVPDGLLDAMKSGQTISIPVWFVLEGEKLYLLPVQGSDTQWYKNVFKNPSIRIERSH